MLRNHLKLVFGLLVLLFCLKAHAFKFSPMSAAINLDQKENRIIFSLENESQSPVAVELTLKKRIMNIDGSEDQPALDDKDGLTVYPEQLIIPPGQRRSVRVSFNGSVPKKELAYRLIAEQLPINLEETNQPVSGIKMLMRYIAAIYIDPGKVKADVYPLSFKKENKQLVLSLENRGGKHQLLQNVSIYFVKKGVSTITLEQDELAGLIGENILAQTKRDFILPQVKAIDKIDSSFEIQFRLNP